MNKLAIFLIAFVTLFSTSSVHAQNSYWIQLEVRPTLRDAEGLARAYANVFENIAGFDMGDGWYAIALGPLSIDEAQSERARLVAENLIPRNSFVVEGSGYTQQLWPRGVQSTRTGSTEPSATTDEQQADAEELQVAVEEPTIQPAADPFAGIPEETVREARASEATLSREEREFLQIALKDAGYYRAAIDGAFGRGTRGAMSRWQRDNGYEATGVLTSRQRVALIRQYNAILEGLGMARVTSNEAGVALTLPTAVVEFTRFDPPFVHFDSTTSDGIRVLLISQQGTEATLAGLYDIMQTLEIVPRDGERSRNSSSFTLTGQNREIYSYTYAEHDAGEIKGFTLIWPAGDTERRERVVNEMRASFTRLDGVLDETLGASGESQRIDLLAGLKIRQPDMSRSGFFVNADGAVVTTAEFDGACSEITIDRDYPAEIAHVDRDLGLAVLKPQVPVAPLAHAALRNGVARLQSEMSVAGYPYQGALNAPTLTFGTLADIRGLGGEEDLQRLSITSRDGAAGGPVFDANGSVAGVLLPAPSGSAQQLPQDVRFAVKSDALKRMLDAAQIGAQFAQNASPIAPVTLTTRAADMTVLVSCWN